MGGKTCIPLRRSNREAAGLRGNETLTVKVAHDTAKREVRIPADLARALKVKAGALQRWDALSFTVRREFVEAISGARQPATRVRRVARTLAALEEKS
jgi:uncharacterized protein YdeI (YjbR/CyaY-like superfamily)